MRRMILMGMGLALLGAAAGCSCVHGVCDCEKPAPPCVRPEAPSAYGYAPPLAPPAAEPVVAPKPLPK